jgi:hypothetical protein
MHDTLLSILGIVSDESHSNTRRGQRVKTIINQVLMTENKVE